MLISVTSFIVNIVPAAGVLFVNVTGQEFAPLVPDISVQELPPFDEYCTYSPFAGFICKRIVPPLCEMVLARSET